jgi:hypothetical protein
VLHLPRRPSPQLTPSLSTIRSRRGQGPSSPGDATTARFSRQQGHVLTWLLKIGTCRIPRRSVSDRNTGIPGHPSWVRRGGVSRQAIRLNGAAAAAGSLLDTACLDGGGATARPPTRRSGGAAGWRCARRQRTPRLGRQRSMTERNTVRSRATAPASAAKSPSLIPEPLRKLNTTSQPSPLASTRIGFVTVSPDGNVTS